MMKRSTTSSGNWSGLTPQHIVISHSTVSPESVVRRVKDSPAWRAFFDAPFTGSKAAAENGQLVYYIGGDQMPCDRRVDLEASSKEILLIGLKQRCDGDEGGDQYRDREPHKWPRKRSRSSQAGLPAELLSRAMKATRPTQRRWK